MSMPQTDWQKVRDLFNEALRRNTDDRTVFLEIACAGHPFLRAEVESLLSSHERSSSFLEVPALGSNSGETFSWRLANGSRLSHFTIIEPIAAGGMGEVYLAEDEKLRRRVALKVLPSDVLGDESRLIRFQREASAVSALNHPNILTIFEFENTDGIHFFASEYVKGVTLRERLDSGPLSVATALDIARQIASALAAAHEAGVVHRDIKPENLMIRDDGLVKVLDFGLAKQRQKFISGETATTLSSGFSLPGMIMGTVSYMSPEQSRGTRVDHRSDIFSLGFVLYEMLTGMAPFRGETASDVIAEILQSAPRPPSRFNSRLPKELDQIVLETLEKDPKARFQSALDLNARLTFLIRQVELDGVVNDNATRHNVSKDSGELAPRISESAYATSGAELAPLIGRETELAKLTDLLVTQSRRLITLTGIGGTGKTRLAYELCRRLEDKFSDGYSFVRLSELREPTLVPNVVAQQMRIQEIIGQPICQTLEDHLRTKNQLLVLDNFEQVIDAAPFVSELLVSCPKLSIVVTSRERLRLQSETECTVPPLPIPNDEAGLEVADLATFGSVQLFVERARHVDPGFEITSQNAPEVGRICSMLDGLPLAIELAAARTRVFSTATILENLQARLAFLTGGAIDLPERQQTMRAAVDWSYDLLNDEEKRLFRRLSVFGCRFTTGAAEAVAYGSIDGTVKDRGTATGKIEFLDTFASLTDKSLLIRRRRPDGETSYGLLEIVREYAESVLDDEDDADTIRRRHALFYLDVAEKAEPHLQSIDSARWIRQLDEEYDNIRLALFWSIKNDPAIAARLVAAIRQFWLTRGRLTEGLNWASEVLRVAHDIPPETLWKVLTVCGNMSQFQGDVPSARDFYTKALAAARETGNKKYVAQSLRGVAATAYIQYDLSEANKLIQEAIDISRSIGDDFGLAAALARLGDISSIQGNTSAAREYTAESLAIFRRLGYLEGISAKLYNLGAIVFLDGDHELARQYFEEALHAAFELGEKINTRLIFDGFAALETERGELGRAARLSGVAESLGTTIGYAIEPAEQVFRDTYLGKLKKAMPLEEFQAEHQVGKRLSPYEAQELLSDSSTGSAIAAASSDDFVVSANSGVRLISNRRELVILLSVLIGIAIILIIVYFGLR